MLLKSWRDSVRRKLLQLSFGGAALVPALVSASSQCAGLQAVGGSCNDTVLPDRINTIVTALFTIAGGVAVIIIVMAGIRYITSTGDSTRIKAAKDTILYAVIGLIVIILGRFIVGYVIGSIAL